MEKVLTGAVESLFDADGGGPLLKRASRMLRWGFKLILRTDRFDGMYESYLQNRTDSHVLDKILQAFNVTYEISEQDRSRIPAKGSLVAVANHPFGGIEGIILGSVLHSVREDVKIMANYLLAQLKIQDLIDMFFFVDPFGKEDSLQSNLKPLRKTIEWLQDGKALGVFPAGEVSRLYLRKLEIIDPSWSVTIARLIRKTRATVLPVYFEGRNSALFHAAGLIHPWLRTLMLPREMLRKTDREINVKIGRPVSFEKLMKFTDEEMIQYIRLRTCMLHNRISSTPKRHAVSDEKDRERAFQPVVPPQDSDSLIKEVYTLPQGRVLVDTEKFVVFMAEAWQIPNVLHEIGRLREITFRQAGEGTGKAIDVDRFDSHYIQLFLWNKERKEIVGGYRLGLTDRIRPWRGIEGLYTSTLFEYGDEFLQRIGPAIEVGRSFVRSEYQKDYHPLMLLWKGIGRFVAGHPQYRNLFGPVSINNDYHSISRQLIAAFARKTDKSSDLAALVRGKNPIGIPRRRANDLKTASVLSPDINALSELIADIENDQQGIPILLKHYMKLGGEFLGLSVDYNFSGVLDVLILVDLAQTNPKMLERYMEYEGMRSFLRHQGRISEFGEAISVNG